VSACLVPNIDWHNHRGGHLGMILVKIVWATADRWELFIRHKGSLVVTTSLLPRCAGALAS
jgi:hypothetical protein